MGTVALAFTGCGGSSTSSTSRANSTPAAAPPTTSRTTSGTSSDAVPGAAPFNAQAAPLLDAYYAALRHYTTACCVGTDYDTEASLIRAYEAADTALTDGLARLTPPPSVAVALQNYITSVHAAIADSEKIRTAVLNHDRIAIRAAIRASRSSPAASAGYKLEAVLRLLGVHNNDVVGYWDGTVTQHGPGTATPSYFVELTVKESMQGEIAGTISYPSLHCGGRLQLTSAPGSILHVYREQITSGRRQCGDGGTIYATVLGGSMAWRWVATGIVVLGSLDHLQRPGA